MNDKRSENRDSRIGVFVGAGGTAALIFGAWIYSGRDLTLVDQFVLILALIGIPALCVGLGWYYSRKAKWRDKERRKSLYWDAE